MKFTTRHAHRILLWAVVGTVCGCGAPGAQVVDDRGTGGATTCFVRETSTAPGPTCEFPTRRATLVVGDSQACAVGQWSTAVTGDQATTVCQNGSTIGWWADERLALALALRPELDSVIVLLGTNDRGTSVSPKAGPILEAIRERQLDCVWVGPTAVAGQRSALSARLKRVVEPTCHYVDAGSLGLQLPDGVHPSPSSAHRLMRLAWEALPPKEGGDNGDE